MEEKIWVRNWGTSAQNWGEVALDFKSRFRGDRSHWL